MSALDVVVTRRGEGAVCIDAVRRVVRALPDVNRDVLYVVMELLHKVSRHHTENKMSPVNLAIVIG